MDSEPVDALRESLGQAESDEERIDALVGAEPDFSLADAERYETNVTALASSLVDIGPMAERLLGRTLDRGMKVGFLTFSLGSIAYRRDRDRASAQRLERIADGKFDSISLFWHLKALNLSGGSLEQLRMGLELEEQAYSELGTSGAAHAVACFLLEIVEYDGSVGDDEKAMLGRSLDLVNEGIDLRPNYAKFFATRGRIKRRLADYSGAHRDFVRAIDLEPRSSVDSAERIRDYKLELALTAGDRKIGGLFDEVDAAHELTKSSVGATTIEIESLRSEMESTSRRLRDAEVRVVSAVAFVATAIGLLQVSVSSLSARPLGEAILLVAGFGVVLFGAVAFGTWNLRRGQIK